jgi:YgiT-type zinc finger domain-containing protein
MKCLVCKHGETRPGHTTVTLEREGILLVVRDVPAQVCANCGEAYVDDAIAARLLETADEAAAEGAEVDIRRYVAA